LDFFLLEKKERKETIVRCGLWGWRRWWWWWWWCQRIRWGKSKTER
jgi:hypothetical protein